MKKLAEALYVRVEETQDPEPDQNQDPVPAAPRVFARVFLAPVDGRYRYVVFAEKTKDDRDGPGDTWVGSFDEKESETIPFSSTSVEELVRDKDQLVVVLRPSGDDGVAFDSNDDSAKSKYVEQIFKDQSLGAALRSAVLEKDSDASSSPVSRDPPKHENALDRVNELVFDLETFRRVLIGSRYADVVEKLGDAFKKNIDSALKIASTILESISTTGTTDVGQTGSLEAAILELALDVLDDFEKKLDEWRRAFDLALVTVTVEGVTVEGVRDTKTKPILTDLERGDTDEGTLEDLFEKRNNRMNEALIKHEEDTRNARADAATSAFDALLENSTRSFPA